MSPWESLLIGFIGGAIGCFGEILLERMHIDDPVHCITTHGITGLWGVVVVGFFVERNPLMSKSYGVFKGGSWNVLGVQILTAVSITLWTSLTTFVELYAIDKSIGLRMSREKELDGADKWEHGIVLNTDHNMLSVTSEWTVDTYGATSSNNGIQNQELIIEDI